jgi:orotidine-5'-phosphate decarboxylase
VVGLDPRWELLPEALRADGDPPTAFRRFGAEIIEAVADLAAAIKPQVAFFEQYGWRGMEAFESVCRLARQRGLLVIGDLKRGDIGSTAEAYAEGWLGGDCLDAITVNPYLGTDALEPFVRTARDRGRGLFVLVRTSNPSACDLQDLPVADGSGTRPLYRVVGDLVRRWGEGDLGECGYSFVGAVVGATYPDEAAELRAALPGVPFLVPGYGAQGGSAADVVPALDGRGLGAVVNSSRDIIFAYRREPYEREFGEQRFDEAARAAAEAARAAIEGALVQGA